MKFVYPEINCVFDTCEGKINTIIIENQSLFSRLLQDISAQVQGLDGKAVLSDKNKILPMDKNMELIDRFFPFEVNQKSIKNKLYTLFERLSEEDAYYHDTIQIRNEVESYLNHLFLEFPYDLDFENLSLTALLKASNVCFADDYLSLSEKLLDYFNIVRELDKNKLFITVGLRNLVPDEEMDLFCMELLNRKIDIIMLESTERRRLKTEKRYIIDDGLCEIL